MANGPFSPGRSDALPVVVSALDLPKCCCGTGLVVHFSSGALPAVVSGIDNLAPCGLGLAWFGLVWLGLACCSMNFEVKVRVKMKVFPGPQCFIVLLASSTCSCYWRHDCCSMNFEVKLKVEMKIFPGPPCFIVLLGSSTCSCYWRHDCCSMNLEVKLKVEMNFFPDNCIL